MVTLLGRQAVQNAVDISKSRLYRRIEAGTFPHPIKDGPRRSVWPSSEIEAIVAATIAGASDSELRELVVELERARTDPYQKLKAELDQAAA